MNKLRALFIAFLNQTIQSKLLVILIVLGSCARLLLCFVHNPVDYLWSDMVRHWSNALHFPRGGYNGAADPIGYQVYLWILQRITHSSRLLVALASGLMSVAMPWTYYRAARGFGLPKVPALWVWVLVTWTPSLFVIYHYIMMETLLLLMEGVALWMTSRYLNKGGTPAFLLCVFFWILACLTKPTVIPLAGISFVWVWWKRSTRLRDIALAIALAFVLVLPQAVRSRLALGFYAPFGNPWLTRIQLRSAARTIEIHLLVNPGDHLGIRQNVDGKFLSPSCAVRPLEPLTQWQIRRASTDSIAVVTIHTEEGEKGWERAYQHFNNDRAEWFAQWRENVVLFLFAPSWPESDSGSGQWDGKFDYFGRWMWAPITIFVLLANTCVLLRRQFSFIPVAVTLFTLTMALQNVILMEGRYRKVVEPLLLINLVWLLTDWNSRRSHYDDLRTNRPTESLPAC